MTIHENASVFFEHEVRDFTGDEGWKWKGHKYAYRLRVDWESPKDALYQRLELLANHPDAGKLAAIVIGFWGPESDSSSSGIIKALAGWNERFTGLRAIFLGDIISEENEISWIVQSDVFPLLLAYPALEVLRVRGGSQLSLRKIKHAALRQLIVEAGGLPRSVVRDICRSEFQDLEHLELWLGTAEYGWDGEVEDLQPILSGKLFPKLEYLGFRNSAVVDEIVPVIVNSPIIERIKTLDLSLGNLTDNGANAFLALPKRNSLERIDLTHHYLTPTMVKKLKQQLPCEVITNDAKEPEDEWRSIAVSE